VAIREGKGKYTVFVADAAGRLKTMLHKGVRVDQLLSARSLKDIREALGDRVVEAVKALQKEELGDFLKRVVSGRLAKIVYTPFVELSDGRLAEECYDPEADEVYYAVYNPETGQVEKVGEVYDEKRGTVYRPVYTEELPARQVLLPSWPEEYGSDEELDREIEAHLDRWHEQLDRTERLLDIAYVKLTYIHDLLPAVPYRRILGPWGRGKTAYIETIGYVCYRPMLLAGCDTEAAIRKTFDVWRGTAIIDEADFKNSTLYATIIKILCIGDRRSTGWYKKCDKDDPEKLIMSCVYGPKILATRARFQDTALESRCLTFIARECVGKVPLFRAENFMRESLKLRNKLLMWRFRNYRRVKEAIKRIEGTEIFEEVYGEKAEGLHPRIKQVFLPLALIAPEHRKEFYERAVEAYLTLQSLDEDEQLERQVFEAIAEIASEVSQLRLGGEHGELGEHPVRTEGVLRIPLSDLSRRLVGEDADRGEVTGMSKRVKRILTDRFGLQVETGRARKRYVLVPPEFLRKTGALHIERSPRSPCSPPAKQAGDVKITELPEPYIGRCAWCGRETELRYNIACGDLSGHACQRCRDEIAGGVEGGREGV